MLLKVIFVIQTMEAPDMIANTANNAQNQMEATAARDVVGENNVEESIADLETVIKRSFSICDNRFGPFIQLSVQFS